MSARSWLVLGLLVTGSSLSAADRDRPFMAASYTKVPESDFRYPEPGSAVDTREYRLVVGIIEFGPGDLGFNLGADYQYTRYVYDGVASRNRDLHRLQLPVGFDYQNRAWRLDGYIAPGVSTSSNVMKDLLNKGSRDDVIVDVRAEATIDATEHRAWLTGLAYDRAFGTPVPYPVFGALFYLGNKLRFRVAFPDPEVRYTPSARQRLVVRLFPAGNEWHVSSDELDDDFDYEVKAWRARATWTLGFKNIVWIDLAAGYEFNRSQRFADDVGRSIHADLDDQAFASIGLRLGNAPIPYTNQIAR